MKKTNKEDKTKKKGLQYGWNSFVPPKKHKLKTFEDYRDKEIRRITKELEDQEVEQKSWSIQDHARRNGIEEMLNDHVKLVSHLEARVLELEKENCAQRKFMNELKLEILNLTIKK